MIDEFVSLVNPVLFEPPFPPEGAAALFEIACLISAIAALIIGESWLFANAVSANPTLENTIAQRIENLKRSGHNWIEVDLSGQYPFAWEGSNQTFKTIQRKYPQNRMRGADYDIAVPMYFTLIAVMPFMVQTGTTILVHQLVMVALIFLLIMLNGYLIGRK